MIFSFGPLGLKEWLQLDAKTSVKVDVGH